MRLCCWCELLSSTFKRGPHLRQTTPSVNKWKEFFIIHDSDIDIWQKYLFTLLSSSLARPLRVTADYFQSLLSSTGSTLSASYFSSATFSVELVVIVMLWEIAATHHLHVKSQTRMYPWYCTWKFLETEENNFTWNVRLKAPACSRKYRKLKL